MISPGHVAFQVLTQLKPYKAPSIITTTDSNFMPQAPKPMILLCDRDKVAIVKAAEQSGEETLLVKRYSLRERSAKEYSASHVRETVELIFRHIMSCLMELEARFA